MEEHEIPNQHYAQDSQSSNGTSQGRKHRARHFGTKQSYRPGTCGVGTQQALTAGIDNASSSSKIGHKQTKCENEEQATGHYTRDYGGQEPSVVVSKLKGMVV